MAAADRGGPVRGRAAFRAELHRAEAGRRPVVAGDRDAELRADDGAAGVGRARRALRLAHRAGDRDELRRRAGARLRSAGARQADGTGADAGVGAVPRHRHRADEGPARARRVQPAGLDRRGQRAAAAGAEPGVRARRDRAVAVGELGRLGRRAVCGVRLVAARPRSLLRAGAAPSRRAGHAVAAADAGARGGAGRAVLGRPAGAAAAARRRDGAGRGADHRVARDREGARSPTPRRGRSLPSRTI